MKILWVKAGGLIPLDTGGKIRSYHLLKELANKHEVTLFTFYPSHPDDRHHELERVFSRVVCLPLQIPGPGSFADYLNYFRNLFGPYPYAMAKYYRPGLADALRKLVMSESYETIVCDFLVPAGIIPWDAPVPKVLFTHNVEAIIWQRQYQCARNPIWKSVCWREYRTMKRVESHYLERADHVLTVSETDRDYFARFIAPSKITVIPTGVDADFFRPQRVRERPNTLVFTGSMDWLPNEDAVLYFVEAILPHIQRRIPDATLRVVGRRPSSRLMALAGRNDHVEVTGGVEDIRAYVRDASVYVVPLRIGGGTRLKIFEAMAMGKAVVATSVGAEGLPVEHGKDIILADDPAEFAEVVSALLGNPAAREKLGKAGRSLVEENYSWASAAARLEIVLVRTAKKNSSRAGSP